MFFTIIQDACNTCNHLNAVGLVSLQNSHLASACLKVLLTVFLLCELDQSVFSLTQFPLLFNYIVFSPCYIDQDSDLEMVAKRVAWGKFSNAGQVRCYQAVIMGVLSDVDCM